MQPEPYPPITPIVHRSYCVVPAELRTPGLQDKIEGALYGTIVGDAVGFLTEFQRPPQIIAQFGTGPFDAWTDRPKRKQLRYRFNRTALWTDDSDQMLLILDMFLRNSGNVSELDFARRIFHWAQNGMSILGDTGCFDIGTTTADSVFHPDYLTHPRGAARSTKSRNVPGNGAVMRTAVVGVVNFHRLDVVESNAMRLAGCTHAAPITIAAAVTTSVFIAAALQGRPVHEAMRLAEEAGARQLEPAERDNLRTFHEYLHVTSMEQLHLAERQIGFCMRPIGLAFFLLREGVDFETAIFLTTVAGGDADTNAAVVGAVLGAVQGKSSIPDKWLDMPHADFLRERFDLLEGLMFRDN